MDSLDFKIEGSRVILPIKKNYDYKSLSLVVGGNIVYERRIEKPKGDYLLWMSHPFIRLHPDSKIEVLTDYFGNKGNDINGNDLFYLHPAKCGGTSVEVAGYNYGIRWGHNIRYLQPSYYHHDTYAKSIVKNPDIFKDKVLFSTVRNPYKRMVSFVYCPFFNIHQNKINDKDEFNSRMKTHILNKNYSDPCYDFIYHKNKKVVPHVLKLENLTEEFNKLMFDYNSKIRMETTTNKSSDFNLGKRFGVKDINEENIKLINEKYHNDFYYFDYDMIV